MRFQGTMKLNADGHLEIGGCDTLKLAQEYGTPLLVIDEVEIRQRCQNYRNAFQKSGLEVETLYASKAFLNMALCRIIEEEGLGLDVVSGGELHIAKAAGFPMQKVFFHGNNKTPGELEKALEAKVGRFVVDNHHELELLNHLAVEKGVVADILFRVTPGIEAHTHEYVQTGQLDSKFGLGIPNGMALKVIKQAITLPGVRVRGIHCHIGSQIFNMESFARTVEVMMDFCGLLRDELNLVIDELDLGGGIGIPYMTNEDEASLEDYAWIVTDTLRAKATQLNLPLPKIYNEPGRYIVATSGTTLYTIGSIKEIPGIKTYVSIDGGMTDNIRPALYDANYEALIANKASVMPTQTVTIAGRCCESGDKLIHDLRVPEVAVGDILAVSCTGAYTASMSSNYNGLPRLAIVFVKDGEAELGVRRETYEDLIRRDLIPDRLTKK